MPLPSERGYNWGALTKQQVGKYAEYFIKMEFLLHGFEVYTTEVDEKGIDFVARRSTGSFYFVQTKSIRYPSGQYIFFPKNKFKLDKSLIAAVLVFREGHPPEMYLIPSLSWKKTDELLRDRDYEGKKSSPEWGLNITEKNLGLLSKYAFEAIVKTL